MCLVIVRQYYDHLTKTYFLKDCSVPPLHHTGDEPTTVNSFNWEGYIPRFPAQLKVMVVL